MRRSARVNTPRCGATSRRVRRQPTSATHRSDSLSLPGDNQGERPRSPGSPLNGPIIFYFGLPTPKPRQNSTDGDLSSLSTPVRYNFYYEIRRQKDAIRRSRRAPAPIVRPQPLRTTARSACARLEKKRSAGFLWNQQRKGCRSSSPAAGEWASCLPCFRFPNFLHPLFWCPRTANKPAWRIL
jgi:hypothetical protein